MESVQNHEDSAQRAEEETVLLSRYKGNSLSDPRVVELLSQVNSLGPKATGVAFYVDNAEYKCNALRE